MNKEIYFCVDEVSLRLLWNKGYCSQTYEKTESHISEGLSPIVTTSIAHLSFDLLTLGYDIYLCYKDKKVKIEPYMDLSGIDEPGKDLRFGHNIFKMFRAGIFNELLGIEERGKDELP